ncbi:MAG TPA: TetR/AcrR family transcriptional regulator [Anaerolineales bacterium]|nr:TetR/AcrR family transcriptional regulator [Anaerolineales bacterium]
MPPKTYKPSQQTKNNIIQKAIDLFNEHGTAAVSLNSLAEALGISTGNLQYHYRSKEEIIRAIFEVMFNDWNAVYQEMGTESFDMDTLRRTLHLNFSLVWKYRFFYRELNALLRNDGTLAKRYAAIQEGRLAEQERLTKQMVRAGGASPMSRLELHRMVLAGWVLSSSWLSYVESTGLPVDEAALDEGVEVLDQFYKPYLEKIT